MQISWNKLLSELITNTWYYLTLLSWTLYFLLFWSKALYVDTAGNLIAGHPLIWADWAAHLTMVTAIAERGVFIANPLILGEAFRYPFATHAISATLLQLGIPLTQAMVLPSLLGSFLLLGSLIWWFTTLLKSKNKAAFATSIFLLSGGLGVFFIPNLAAPLTYATYAENTGIVLINTVVGMSIPQKPFSWGMSFGLIALTLILHWWKKIANQADNTKQNQGQLVISGFLLGLLPIIHTHSYLATGIILACWSGVSLISKRIQKKHFLAEFKGWLIIMVAALSTSLLSFGLMGFNPLAIQNSGQAFMHLQLGWLASNYNQVWPVFVLKNWGISIVIAAVSTLFLLKCVYRTKRQMGFKNLLQTQLLTVSGSFWGLFLIAQTISFQPNVWDNSKMFAWAYLGLAGLITYGLAQLPTKLFPISLVLISLLISAGGIDVLKSLNHDNNSYQLSSSSDLSLARWVTQNTPEDSIWLTANTHTHWLFTLTGRQAIMTYPGWLWSHGYEYDELETLTTAIYTQGLDQGIHLAKLRNLGVTHIVVGPYERAQFRLHPSWLMSDSTTLPPTVKLIHQTETTAMYALTLH